MPEYGVASALEMDAAAALLTLHSGPQPQEAEPLDSSRDERAEMTIGCGRALPADDADDVTSGEFRNRLSVKVTSTPLKSKRTNLHRPMRPISPRIIRVIAPCSENNGYIVKKTFRASLPAHKTIHDAYLEEMRRWSEITKHNAQFTISTRDVATQTAEDETGKEAETKLASLTKRIKELEEQLQEILRMKDKLQFEDASEHSDDSEPRTHISVRNAPKRKFKSSTATFKEEFISDDDEDYVAEADMDTDDEYELEEEASCRNTTIRRKSIGGNTGQMVPIGCGKASVSARVLRQINWSSYTSATRKLLTAIFPRSILATHSLTGKPSPAFPNKPAKKKLDPALVDDIIQTVVQKCSVPESIVRTSITTKCADESKMFRSRQNKRKTSRVARKENEPPVTSSSSVPSR